jgi:hypothetical protein
MKRIALLVITTVTVAGVVAFTATTSRRAMAQEAAIKDRDFVFTRYAPRSYVYLGLEMTTRAEAKGRLSNGKETERGET